MKIKKKKGGGGANWQDTYGDMVTLLLCFFVLLFAISTVDQVKWKNLVRSLNPNADKVSQVIMDPEIDPGEEEVPGSVQSDKAFEELYEGLVQEMKELGVEDSVKIVDGEGYTFISYRDNVFFDGDSPVLRKEGKKVLDGFARATKPAVDAIGAIHIMGHTSQADPNKQNNIEFDRQLSSQRAANVTAYLQHKKLVDPANLVAEGYGQFHPIATFKTRAGRQKNRRAEILILQKDTAQRSLDEYYEEVYGKEAAKASKQASTKKAGSKKSDSKKSGN